jgi:hypothetical protein
MRSHHPSAPSNRVGSTQQTPFHGWTANRLPLKANSSTFGVWTQFTVLTGKRSEISERNAIGHTRVRFKRTCVGSNGILECKFLSEKAHRTHSTTAAPQHQPRSHCRARALQSLQRRCRPCLGGSGSHMSPTLLVATSTMVLACVGECR